MGTVTVYDDAGVSEANSGLPARWFAPGLRFDRVDTAVAENDMIDVEAIRGDVVENERPACSELIELLGNDPLTIPPEPHAAKSSAKSHALPCGVECGGHREARKEPGLRRHVPERHQPFKGGDDKENGRKQKREREFVPEECLDGLVSGLPREAKGLESKGRAPALGFHGAAAVLDRRFSE